MGRTRGTARHWRFATVVAVATVAMLGTTQTSVAVDAPVLPNGGFERGSLVNWHRTGESEGWRAVRGTSAPFSNNAIPAAPVGHWQGVVDQTGPGSHILYRDITLPDDQFLLSLTVWYRNHAGEFHTPRRLTVGPTDNQQLRIDLVDPGAPIRSMAAGDILANVMRTRVGDPNRMRPGEVVADLTPYAGQTIRLRIAEVDNLNFFNVGIDAVHLIAVPCPPNCS
jgi:hypothetical protein